MSCDICGGLRGGVPGNGQYANDINGFRSLMCDDCHADSLTGRYRAFRCEVDALAYLHSMDACVDQEAIGYWDDEASMATFFRIREGGCCGSFDADVIIAGRRARIGCNYGH